MRPYWRQWVVIPEQWPRRSWFLQHSTGHGGWDMNHLGHCPASGGSHSVVTCCRPVLQVVLLKPGCAAMVRWCANLVFAGYSLHVLQTYIGLVHTIAPIEMLLPWMAVSRYMKRPSTCG